MRLSTARSRIVGLLSATLAASSLVTLANPASAAVPSEVNIRLSADDKAAMDNKTETWCKDNKDSWCPYNKGVGTYLKFVVAGDNLVLNYTVTDMSNNPVANTKVTLNKNVNGGSFTGSLEGTTDASGKVTFTLKSTTSPAIAEPYPVAPSSLTNWDQASRCPNGVCPFTEMKFDVTPTIGSALEHADWVWTHTVKPQNYVPTTPPPAIANIRLSDDDKLSMTDKSYWWTNEPLSHSYVKFVVAGDELVLRYRVTDGSNKPVANIPLVLSPSDVVGASFTGTMTQNTDANGYATFTLLNTTSVDNAEPAPTSPSNMSYWDDTRQVSPQSKYNLNPSVGAATEHVDRVWTHTVKSAGSSVVPKNVTIRLAGSFVDPQWNVYEATDWIAAFYPANTKAYVKYVDAGATMNLVYRAVDTASGDPVVNQNMSLIVNANGTERTSFASGSTVIPAQTTVRLSSRTDVNGYATFTLRNTNNVADAEPAPAALNQVNASWSATPAVELGSNVQPTFGAEKEVIDILFPHVTKSGGAISGTSLPAKVNIRLKTPVIDTNTNAYDASSWVAQYFAPGTKAYVQYLSVGAPFSLTYKVTDSTGAAVANTSVRLKVNANGDKPSFISGNTVVASTQKAYLSGRTDSNGEVTFALVNTNSAAEAEPVPANLYLENPSWRANPPVELGGNFQVTAGAGSEATDIYFPHFTKPVEVVKAGTPGAPTLTSVVAGNAKLTINFTAGTTGTGGATKYFGYSLDGGKTWVDSSKNTKSPIALTTGIVNGTNYAVKVRAFNAVGYGLSSGIIVATPKADPPAAPTLSAATGGPGSVTITFKAGVTGGAPIIKYQVSLDNGVTWSDLPTLTSPTTITGLGYATAYVVKVRAVNSSGAGVASAAKSVTTTKVAQTISFTQPANMKVGQADQTLTVSASSGLAVTLTTASAAICTVVNGKLRAVGKGSCSVTATQTGSTMYAAATAVTKKITITL